MSRFIQSLETRTLFSAGVHHALTADPSTLTADQQKVQADLAQYKTDGAAALAAFKADYAKMQADKTGGASNLTDLLNQLKNDTAASKLSYTNDLNAIKAQQLQDYPTLVADVQQTKADEAAGVSTDGDKAKFSSDHAAMEAHTAPLIAAMKQHLATWKTTLANDTAAIAAARNAPKDTYKSDAAKLAADIKSWKKVIDADRKQLNADIKQLKADGGTYDGPTGDTTEVTSKSAKK